MFAIYTFCFGGRKPYLSGLEDKEEEEEEEKEKKLKKRGEGGRGGGGGSAAGGVGVGVGSGVGCGGVGCGSGDKAKTLFRSAIRTRVPEVPPPPALLIALLSEFLGNKCQALQVPPIRESVFSLWMGTAT
ncbi:hypothetical protein M0802_005069 [Mischocyttarus mexicanus]|nr:hypothetical protein M0802_005069 [Mischocyttarus mexicanus]